MNEAADFAVSAVILSERSLPAVVGEPKDLYLPRPGLLPSEADLAQAVDPMEVLRHERQCEEK
ncbi:MAG TPA: hypothetical protein VGS15_11330 [Candidatus Acidoferrales bacterium]|nr:hypothetical protein [Candidatus Acidoferrales bacterium]